MNKLFAIFLFFCFQLIGCVTALSTGKDNVPLGPLEVSTEPVLKDEVLFVNIDSIDVTKKDLSALDDVDEEDDKEDDLDESDIRDRLLKAKKKKKAKTTKATKAPTTKSPTLNPTHAPSGPVVYRQFPSGRKFFKIIFVFDASAVAQLGGGSLALQRASAILKNLKTIFIGLPPLFLQIADLFLWSVDDEMRALGSTSFQDDNSHLVAFNSWRSRAIQMEHAVGHFFTGEAMQSSGDDRVLAAKRSACNKEMSSSISSIFGLTDDLHIAKYAAHAIAHTLGLEHLNMFSTNGVTLEESMACSKDLNEVMQTGRNIDRAPRSYSWSACSKKWLSIYFNGVGCVEKDCVVNPIYNGRFDFPACMETPAVEDKIPMCGDGVVNKELGEECDCGDAEQCKDKCCNANTCKLSKNATCSANDACCNPDTCAPFANEAKVVCRPAISSCDVEDMCDGVSKECPADVKHAIGTSCLTPSNRPGSCSGDKVCQNYLDQCLFETQNPRVTPCPLAKLANPCARLSCQVPGVKNCVATTIPMGNGTPCGTGKFCRNGQCLLLSAILGG